MALAAGSTIAGNLFILGAASNVLIIQNAEKSSETLTFQEFAQVGMPLTLLNVLVYWQFLWIISVKLNNNNRQKKRGTRTQQFLATTDMSRLMTLLPIYRGSRLPGDARPRGRGLPAASAARGEAHLSWLRNLQCRSSRPPEKPIRQSLSHRRL